MDNNQNLIMDMFDILGSMKYTHKKGYKEISCLKMR